MDPFEILWEAPEYEHHQKETGWYWASIGVVVFLVGVAAWQGNALFIAFLVVAEILILVWALREPRTYTFALNERGIHIGDNLSFSYNDMEHFSIAADEEDAWATLRISLKSRLRPTLRVHLPKDHHTHVQERLRPLVQEIEAEESFQEALERLLRF